MFSVENYLFRYFVEKGYGSVVFYSHIAGDYSSFNPSDMDRDAEVTGKLKECTGN